MAHGTPDWGVTAGAATTYQLTDLAEHAVRVGSIDRFDRRGDVLALAGFEDLALPPLTVLGSGGALDLSLVAARSGVASMRLRHDGAAGASAEGFWRFPFPTVSRFGLELSFDPDATIGQVQVSLALYDGTNQDEFTARWLASSETLQVLNPAGAWVAVATGLSFAAAASLFQTIKLVADFAAGSWTRLIMNENSYTPTTGPRQTTPSANPPYLEVSVLAVGDGGSVAGQAYVDDVIVTQNEPA